VVLVASVAMPEEPPQANNKPAVANSSRAPKQRRAELPQATPTGRCGCSMLYPPSLRTLRQFATVSLDFFPTLRVCVFACARGEPLKSTAIGLPTSGLTFPLTRVGARSAPDSRSGSGLPPPLIAPYDPVDSVCAGACARNMRPSFIPRLSPCAKPPAPSSGVKATTVYFRLRISVLRFPGGRSARATLVPSGFVHVASDN